MKTRMYQISLAAAVAASLVLAAVLAFTLLHRAPAAPAASSSQDPVVARGPDVGSNPMPQAGGAATGVEADFAFVPHSGPFARGIHVTIQGSLKSARDTSQVLGLLREFYADAPFVRVLDSAPRVKNVATSNYAHLSAAANGRTVAVMCVLDNLTKGAAGGAVQWMNRLFDLPETSGLLAPAPGWT